MSGRIPRSFIDELLVRTDIVDLIDSHVPLKKSGNNFVARCPFHNEKTPSFSVNRSKQFYYCFGCGASGNAIGFLMDYCHQDFVEAVEDLATFVGVEVIREQHGAVKGEGQQQDIAPLLEVLRLAADYYSAQLRDQAVGQQAVAYFKSRGVSGKVARDFLLGYAPDSWRELSKRFNQRLLLEAGLVVSKEGGTSYDRFRGRVMFPIRDRRGRVVGFGGRVLDNSLPKYLNSPETPVFHKGREVYGLYEVLEKKSKPERILIVEGYMDVIALSQYGIDFSVATLGTATSRAHLDLLFRFSNKLIFCFDGDVAGREAAWRAMEAALPCIRDGREIRIMLLPLGSDPDAQIREKGLADFLRKLDAAKALSDYFFTELSAELSLNDIEGQTRLVEKAKPYLGKIPESVFREKMFARLQQLAQLEALPNIGQQQVTGTPRRRRDAGRQRESSPAQTAIALLLQYPALIAVVEEKNIDWSTLQLPGIDLLMQVAQHIQGNAEISLPGLVERFRGLPEHKYIERLARREVLVPDVNAEFSGALDQLRLQAKEQRLEQMFSKEKVQGLAPQEQQLLRKELQELTRMREMMLKK